MDDIASIIRAASDFETEAKSILGFHESSIHRIADLDDSYQRLGKLHVIQADMLRQSLRCIEVEVYRGAHVMGWAAIADFLQRHAGRDGFAAINSARPKWGISDLDDLRDRVGEYVLIEGMKEASLITKSEMKGLKGLLNKRNECAHPTDYFPDLNQSLGFVSECIDRLGKLLAKYGSV